ncbi:hypothetical protein QJS10_CPA05g01592 [Acorus calamus]|uniref:Uncharacterized protein n=1 Tax=Acorus calamus TaxID=4465 RepID=A0AAV9EVR8_ACOCL|nr:hypothetical protein QJS10_CPA05g01592 [Acorus calamus]
MREHRRHSVHTLPRERDVFNLVGCLLEPATLYTIVTVILVLQIIYYDHILRWWRCRGIKPPPEVDGDDKNNALRQVLLLDANMQQVTAPVRRLRSLPAGQIYALESCDAASPHFDQINAQLILSGLLHHPFFADRAIKKLCSPLFVNRAVSVFTCLNYP